MSYGIEHLLEKKRQRMYLLFPRDAGLNAEGGEAHAGVFIAQETPWRAFR